MVSFYEKPGNNKEPDINVSPKSENLEEEVQKAYLEIKGEEAEMDYENMINETKEEKTFLMLASKMITQRVEKYPEIFNLDMPLKEFLDSARDYAKFNEIVLVWIQNFIDAHKDKIALEMRLGNFVAYIDGVSKEEESLIDLAPKPSEEKKEQ